MQDFNVIPVFVAVVEAGGFSAAAQELGISKSAVSKRITQLEDQLGVRLLHRTTRKLSLTEAGEHYFEHAVAAARAAQNAEDSVAQLQGEPRGKLKINVPMSFGLLHVAPLIPEFLKRYPKISVDMLMDDKVVDLVEQGFDVAIRAGDLPDSSLVARKLAPLHSVVCASPEYLSQQGIPEKPADLEQHNCMLFSYSAGLNQWAFTPVDQASKDQVQVVRVTGNYQVNSSEALKEAVLKGLGIGRLPSFVAGEYIRQGVLVNLFEDYRMPSKTVYAVFPERHYLPAKVRVFVDFAVEYFGKDVPYWDESVFKSESRHE